MFLMTDFKIKFTNIYSQICETELQQVVQDEFLLYLPIKRDA